MAALLKIALFVAALVGIVSATDGGDVGNLYSTATYQCAKKNGWNFVIVRSYRSYGGIDVNAPANLANAKAAGIPYRDVYHFPCYGKVSASKQMTDSYNGVKGMFGMMWLDMESNPSPGCGFSANYANNCQFLKDLIATGNKLGIKMGIYSSAYMWSSLFGSSCTAGAAAGLPIWYAHYDGKRTFSDFKPFGGWTKPAIKQYADHVGMCGLNADANWY